MNWMTIILVYSIVWWIMFFMTLPFGVEPIQKNNKGYVASAPKKPYLLIKAFITSILAGFLTYIFFYLLLNGHLAFLIE